MTWRLLLDEHCSKAIAASLRQLGHDVGVAVADPELGGASDPGLFRWAAEAGRRIVTESTKDFRPLLLRATTSGAPAAPFLLVPPRRFPRGRGDRTAAIAAALQAWLAHPDADRRPVEDWLV
ncbi:DUF5615 family PIN-like protein [Georgenia sp. TF02-10]|uniref:DUF5615 family PIN-like protein n=1 Tax=Georgenia sp. TF02-10 TaxID=2917725 RepID=UPI001FA7460C|nr:DUF5615 family PIN-like protein [Georgenia sp. TF02-10]UNX56151.1 DUF5615 family PIN-like protein [Georgenia sp. TF02-10]